MLKWTETSVWASVMGGLGFWAMINVPHLGMAQTPLTQPVERAGLFPTANPTTQGLSGLSQSSHQSGLPSPNLPPLPADPEQRAVVVCQRKASENLQGNRVHAQITSQMPDRFMLRWSADNGYSGTCRIARSGQLQVFTGNYPALDLTREARRIELQQKFQKQTLNKFRNVAIAELQQQGYAAMDDGKGVVSFLIDRGQFEVKLHYNPRTPVFQEVEVRSNGL